MIWAQARHRALGRDGTLAWHLPEDMAFFRHLTTGHPVIMGRKTWDSLGKYQPLPNRLNIVVSRSSQQICAPAQHARSLPEAIALAKAADSQRAWIIGGAQLYHAALPLADALVVTDIDIDVPDADVFAPPIPDTWSCIAASPTAGWHTSKTGLPYRFRLYRRPTSQVELPDFTQISERVSRPITQADREPS
ncbi:dihydrofolate reductase [Trueperella sp. LYQ143]|uniref:dihydrofolate reductase n=1 Tax=unclassified Trueperella TaxID=2630174 RepID=UPI0039838EDF